MCSLRCIKCAEPGNPEHRGGWKFVFREGGGRRGLKQVLQLSGLPCWRRAAPFCAPEAELATREGTGLRGPSLDPRL